MSETEATMLTLIPGFPVSCFHIHPFLLSVEKKNSGTAPVEAINSAWWKLLLFVNIPGLFESFGFILWYGKLNKVADERFGATIVTLFVSINNAGFLIPNTIGLKLVALISSYVSYVVVVLIASVCFLAFLYPICQRLDRLEREDFLLPEDKKQQDSVITQGLDEDEDDDD